MGERSEFHSGEIAPNNGVYIEVGVKDHIMGIENPQQVKLKKGDKFPDNRNDDRVWMNKRRIQPK
ncbi:YjzC family protein [Paenibacillus sp. N3/727]|uniref:YjzC family protein n=1 Tax=Paenibacillus sp. N3/727 TaxID=2925845 RepID=UPI001F53D80A|nr:YjzC family protein [Paenibacillus sp. N3/727]UNK21447.1 YjzC family protein [Paenibacillus sp. N3/727]